MSPNGAVALSLVELASASIESFAPAEVELKLGEVVAVGVTMLCKAIVSHHERGVFDPDIKDVVATQVTAVAMLGLDHEGGDADFIHKARKAGYTQLHRYFDDCDIPPNVNPDAAINICLDEMLNLVGQIIKNERIFQLTMAN